MNCQKRTTTKKYCITWCSFFGTVPTIPNKLRGIDEADTMEFGGGFDKAAVVLSTLGKEYNDTSMTRAAEIFSPAALVITKIKEVIVDYLK